MFRDVVCENVSRFFYTVLMSGYIYNYFCINDNWLCRWSNLSLFISLFIGAGAGFGLSLLPNNWGDRSLKLIVNIGVSAGLLIGLIDRLFVTSYTMGCVIESSNFAAQIYTPNSKLANLWNKATVGKGHENTEQDEAFKQTSSEQANMKQDGGNEEEEDFSQYTTAVGKAYDELERVLFEEGGPMWHPKCTSEEEKRINADDLDNKAYCYTTKMIDSMRALWKAGGKQQEQAIFNTCMRMYYGQHSLLGGLFTDPSFIGFNCAARYAFFINLISFSSGIILLILSDKEKGLTKLGSLVGAKNYQETFSDL